LQKEETKPEQHNERSDFESNCSGAIGDTDDLLLAPPMYLGITKSDALRMVFKTIWGAQANLPQELRCVTSVQLLKAANEKHNFATPIKASNLDNALKGKKATSKKNPDGFGSYIPNYELIKTCV
jgi:antitoxin component of RelBE/YafQ-DinJ toxin-antitoxin module